MIQEIKQSINLIDYIGQYIKLEKRSHHHQGICPFHSDSDPSLTVWENGTWKCFGCGVGGDIFDFYALFHNTSLKKAFEHFCGKQETIESAFSTTDNIIRFLKKKEEELQVYKRLPKLEKFVDKCYQNKHSSLRQWNKEVIKTFKLGFCVDPTDELYGRITIPIWNENNILVGVAGGWVKKNEKNKYINKTGMTKRGVLYALNYSLSCIRKKREMIIVEGYKDVWKMWEAGVKNVVGIMGNMASNRQLDLIMKYGQFNLILGLDNDESGERGTKKIIKELNRFCNIRTIKLPDGIKDLGECNLDMIHRILRNGETV